MLVLRVERQQLREADLTRRARLIALGRVVGVAREQAAHHTIADALVDGGIQQLWDRGNVEEARKYFNAALEHEAASADAPYGVGSSARWSTMRRAFPPRSRSHLEKVW